MASITDTAPSDATQASLTVAIASCAAGEVHYVDCAGIFPGTVTVWTRGGMVGLTTTTITYTDTVNTTPVDTREATNLAIPAATQQVTISDYEAIPGVTRTYTATISYTVGNSTVTSSPSTPATATINATNLEPDWWLIDPVTPSLSIPLTVTGYPTSMHEQLTTHYPLGQKYPTIVTDVVNGTDGQLQVETTSPAAWTTLQSVISDQRIKWLMSPYGDGLYIRIGGAAPTMGISGQVHQAQIAPSTPQAPYRQITLQYVNVGRP